MITEQVQNQENCIQIYRVIMIGHRINNYRQLGRYWYRSMIKSRTNLVRKINPTGYIFIPGSQFYEAEVHLNLRSCLYDSIINSVP